MYYFDSGVTNVNPTRLSLKLFFSLCESGHFAKKAGIPNMFDNDKTIDDELTKDEINTAMLHIKLNH